VPIGSACSNCRLPERPTQIDDLPPMLSSNPGGPSVPHSERGDSSTLTSRELIALIGCVKTKLPHAARARDLYVSPLFRDRVSAVEGRVSRWFVISAEYGLLDPDEWIQPYDRSLTDLSRAARRDWSTRVLSAMRLKLGALERYAFEIHAGADYFDFGLAEGLKKAGAEVSIPTEGLPRWRQHQYYAHAGQSIPTVPSSTPALQTDGGRYGRIADWLDDRGQDVVSVSFEELEIVLGRPLPKSARQYAAWWQGQAWSRFWRARGWRAAPRFKEAAVVFRHVAD
jgi:hypothetical protein